MLKRILGFLVGPPKPATVPPSPSPRLDARLPSVGPTVAIINNSTVLNDVQVATATAALQIQVDRDFAPIWKTGANLVSLPKNSVPPTNAWVIYLMDTSDEAGALGYHDLTPQGNPIAKVFAKDDAKYGLSWTVTLSHELLEMLVDPYIENCVFDQKTNTTGTLYAFEVCDAPEDDSFGYLINGVRVSDFVYPAWFEGFRAPNSTRFDFMNVIHAPFALARGGYIGVFQVRPGTSGWTQKTAEGAPGARMLSKKDRPYGRINRRSAKGT